MTEGGISIFRGFREIALCLKSQKGEAYKYYDIYRLKYFFVLNIEVFIFLINPFWLKIPFLYPLKTSEKTI